MRQKAVLLVRIGINADPDPNQNQCELRIYADQDPGQTLKSQKDEFLHEKYRILYVEKRSQNIPRKEFFSFLCLFERQKTRFIGYFW